MAVPYTFANGVGNVPDADQVMGNFNYLAGSPVITKMTTGDGTSSAPTHTFSGNTAVGLFRDGSRIGLAAPTGGGFSYYENGSELLRMESNVLSPITTDLIELGGTSLRYKNIYASRLISLASSQSGADVQLTVNNSSNTSASNARVNITVGGSSGGDAYIDFLAVREFTVGIDNSDDDSFVIAKSSALGTTNILRIDGTSGSITKPLQPCFLATNGTGATDVTGDGTTYTILWPTEIFDQDSNFASNTFTAPITGRYQLQASVLMKDLLTSHYSKTFSIVTSNRTYTYERDGAATTDTAYTFYSLIMTVLADMDINDTAIVQVTISGGTKTVDVFAGASHNTFSGSLIN